MAYESGWVSIIELQNGQTVSDKFDSAFSKIDSALVDIDGKLNGAGYDFIQWTPQATPPPTLNEGMIYYDLPSHSFVGINDVVGTKLNFGHEVVERMTNQNVGDIADGKVVAVSDVDVDGDFEAILAKADTLDTAVAFGVTTSVLPENGTAVGLVTRIGRVNGVDTVGVLANQPLYLSDTIAGALTGTSPEISTVIGFVVKAQSGAGIADGVIYVAPRSIISLPNVVAFMNQDVSWVTPVSLDSTPISITNYDPADSGKRIMTYNDVNGTILASGTGIYDVSLDFDSLFNDIGNSVLHVLIEVIEDGSIPVARYNKLIGKNSTSANGSMTKTFVATEGLNYSLRVSCPDGTLGSFTLENVSFSMKSIDIR